MGDKMKTQKTKKNVLHAVGNYQIKKHGLKFAVYYLNKIQRVFIKYFDAVKYSEENAREKQVNALNARLKGIISYHKRYNKALKNNAFNVENFEKTALKIAIFFNKTAVNMAINPLACFNLCHSLIVRTAILNGEEIGAILRERQDEQRQKWRTLIYKF